MKHFIVIDMQNDFCTGALANKDAVAIIPRIKAELQAAKAAGMHIIFTQDSHDLNYLDTNEGKHLPVPHCIRNSEGWKIVPELLDEVTIDDLDSGKAQFNEKMHFSFDKWTDYIKSGDEVVMCGTCTDICVISNALAIKAIDDVEVTVIADCCAGLTKEKHNAALNVMESCQCTIR